MSSARLTEVTCTNANFCQAGGKPDRLRVVPTPNPSGAIAAELSGLACPAANGCVAVGETTVDGQLHSLALGQDEAGWSIEPTPPRGARGQPSFIPCKRL